MNAVGLRFEKIWKSGRLIGVVIEVTLDADDGTNSTNST